jgi:RNA polymerase sigma factor (sigma-70 family)
MGHAAFELSDRELTGRALAGDSKAFDELYRRHEGAAWRLAQAVTRSRDDAADAVSEAFARVFTAMRRGVYSPDAPFRPYLLTATRNAAIDAGRKAGRVIATDDQDVIDRAAEGGARRGAPADAIEESADATMIAAAFAALPERWRSVLWLAEVEGMRPRDVAPLMGLSANGAAQLAVRARAGLRQRYLQAHLRESEEHDCRRTISHLGAYVAGTLSPRDTAHVDQHLAACAECRERVDELEDVGTRLRAVMLPLPLLLAGAASAKWAAAVGASSTRFSAMLPGVRRLPAWAQRTVVGSAAAAVAAGVLSATILLRDPSEPDRELAIPAGRTEEPSDGPDVDGVPPANDEPAPTISIDDDLPGRSSAFARPRAGAPEPSAIPAVDGAGNDGSTDDGGGSNGGGSGDGGSVPPVAPTPPVVPPVVPPPLGGDEGVVEVSVAVPEVGAAVGIGGGDIGVQVGPIQVGTPPATPDAGIEVDLDGTLLEGLLGASGS